MISFDSGIKRQFQCSCKWPILGNLKICFYLNQWLQRYFTTLGKIRSNFIPHKIEKNMVGIVAIKLSSDLMDGEPITEVTLYNVKAGEGGADRPCSQFQNVFAQISNCIFSNFKIYLPKYYIIFFQISKCICPNFKLYFFNCLTNFSKLQNIKSFSISTK